MTTTAPTHCCQCTEEAGEQCTHLVGRLLCRDHGQVEVPFNERPIVLDIPAELGDDVDLDGLADRLVEAGQKPICSACGHFVETPGALLFGPPDPYGQCRKHHVCADCYPAITMRFVD